MKIAVINRFDGGMVNDPRDIRSNVCRLCKHFDAFTDPHRLVPRYSQIAGDSSSSTQKLKNFAFDGAILYAYGHETSAGTNSFIYKVTAVTTSTWTTVKNTQREVLNANNSAVDNFPFFAYYGKTSALYGAGGGRYFWKYAPGTDTLTNQAYDATSYTVVSNAIVHSKDDIMYVGADNKIIKNDNDSWSVGLTLSTRYVITSICEYGDFVAVGVRHKGTGNSRVFLWNRDETTMTVSESIDWESGALLMLEELEGYLVGVSFTGISNWDASASFDNLGKGRTILRSFAGAGGATKFAEFTGFDQTRTIQGTMYKFKNDHRILFPATIYTDGTPASQGTGQRGIWSITRGSQGFALTKEFSYLNDTGGGGQFGLIQIGNFLYDSYYDGASHYTDRTDNAITFTQSSIIETIVNQNMEPADRLRKKQLGAVAVFTEKLTSGMQVVVDYKVDGGAWTTVLTKTSSSPDTDLVGYETAAPASGQFTSGREYEFRITSTGGAVPTALAYGYGILPILI